MQVEAKALDLETIAVMQAQERRNALEALNALPAHNLSVEMADYHVYRWHDSYSRMGALLNLRPKMRYQHWLTLLGGAWNTSDNLRDHLAELRSLLGTDGPLLPMMTHEERAVYDSLPDRVTVYQGCSARFLRGACWSLDEQMARKYPFFARFLAADPVLVTGTVRKKNILAVLLSRGDQEVVTFKARRVKVERL